MIKNIYKKFLLFPLLLIYSVTIYSINLENIQTVFISVDDKKCNPMKITKQNGKIQFIIKNDSHRKLEWEILKGVMVIDERENIAPGFIQKMTTNLETGEYKMTCGLLSNPKGDLLIENKKEKENTIDTNTKKEFFFEMLEYKKYVVEEIEKLVSTTKIFVNHIKRGNFKEAKDLFAFTRQYYERIEPVAEIFFDLDKKIDAREEDYEKKSDDPNFRGFHKIEKILFFDENKDFIIKYANFLYKDILELQSRIQNLKFLPNKVVGGASSLMEEIATYKISGEENKYSKTDLWDFSANIEGAKKIFDLFRSSITESHSKFLDKIENNFNKIKNILQKYKKNNGYETYDKLQEIDYTLLKSTISFLAEDLAIFRGILGLD